MLSVIVKTFNEEANIAKCIESIIRETECLEREIIVVDSLSTDQTVAISKKYPAKVVQFVNQEDCGCGAAPQLGYQVSIGRFIYLIDGDMEMIPGFLKNAMTYLLENPSVAGVGGILVDTSHETIAERRRLENYHRIKDVADVSSLGGGGLYRRAAIESVGYFSHRGLKATEELELGLRLNAKGWQLVRLPVPSVMHSGHKESYLQSIKRLWHNGRLEAHGVLIRSSLGKKWFGKTVLHCWYAVLPVVMILFALLLNYLTELYFSYSVGCLAMIALVLSLAVLLMAIRKKSIKLSIISVSSWFIIMIASLKGMLHSSPSPHNKIPFLEL